MLVFHQQQGIPSVKQTKLGWKKAQVSSSYANDTILHRQTKEPKH